MNRTEGSRHSKIQVGSLIEEINQEEQSLEFYTATFQLVQIFLSLFLHSLGHSGAITAMFLQCACCRVGNMKTQKEKKWLMSAESAHSL